MKKISSIQLYTNQLSAALLLLLHTVSHPSSPFLLTLQLFSVMAALWLHSASLLILLVMSCPGSKAFSSPFLCGRDLVDVLYLFCADRGFVYPKRNVDSVLRFLPAKAGGAAPADTNFASKNQMEMMVKRGIGDQCCHRPCSILDLEKYCI